MRNINTAANNAISNKPIVRCAIYTRKSTSKGLDLAFNSLDAQRVYCENYIKTREHDGWYALPNNYDDGAVSGATLKRPGLQQLLADVKAKIVDMVVVYKMDRLGRSLRDSLNTIQMFKDHDVAVASVTQQFDTSTSIGRLVLHIMLSMAECERDIARERTLDKIDISKKKGIWVGGMVPFGYDWVNKKLVVNSQEAEVVKLIFAEFIKTHSLKAIVKMLRERDIKNKVRINSSGRSNGGNYFNSNAIYNMLRNPVYIGKIPHQGELYDGQHEAIIADEIWQAARTVNSVSPRKRAARAKRKVPAMLQGLLRCGGCDSSMTPSHTRKKGKIYRYYVPNAHNKGSVTGCPIKQVSAPEIESLVLEQVQQVLASPEVLVDVWQHANDRSTVGSISEHSIRELLGNVHNMWQELWPLEQQRLLRLMLEKVMVKEDAIEVRIRADCIGSLIAEFGNVGQVA